MGIENLPIIRKGQDDLKVVERAELTFRDGGTVLAYVAGRTRDGLLVYDSSAVRKGSGLYIEFNFFYYVKVGKIKNYMPLNRRLEVV